MTLSSTLMPSNKRDVLEGPGNPLPRHLIGFHRRALLALVPDLALLRDIEARNHVQHRGFAGARSADDRADLALADIKADIGDRLHPAKAQRDVLHLHHHRRRSCGHPRWYSPRSSSMAHCSMSALRDSGGAMPARASLLASRRHSAATFCCRTGIADFQRGADRPLAAVLIGHFGRGRDFRSDPS